MEQIMHNFIESSQLYQEFDRNVTRKCNSLLHISNCTREVHNIIRAAGYTYNNLFFSCGDKFSRNITNLF